MRIGIRCLLDGLGLFVAGSEEHSVRLLIEEAADEWAFLVKNLQMKLPF